MLAESHKLAAKIISLHLCLCLKWKYVAYNSLRPFFSAVCLGDLWCRGFLALKQVKRMSQYAELQLMSQEPEQTAFSTKKNTFQKFSENLIFFFSVTKSLQGNKFSHRWMLIFAYWIWSFLGLVLQVACLFFLALHSHMVQLTLSGLTTCMPLTNIFWEEIKTFLHD